MAPIRLLVCNAPEDPPALLIDPPRLAAALGRAGGTLEVEPAFLTCGDPAMGEALSHASALVGWRLPTDLIRMHGTRLRLIQLTNAGVDNLAPFDWLAPHTALCNVSGIQVAKLQEWAAMALLMLNAQMPHFATAQRGGLWSRLNTPLIAGKTALIFGTGSLGTAAARAARGLGLRAVGIRRTPAPTEGFDDVLGMADHIAALKEADFVILALPLTSETRGLAGPAFFAAMRAGAGFANVGRGALVDQPALCAALERGHLAGAIIDVATPEPLPPDSALWATRNLVITPHVSCDDPLTYIPNALDVLTFNLLRLTDGHPFRNQVDPALGY
jgi:phosphoglycerate dehydrogenase-like enzyme